MNHPETAECKASEVLACMELTDNPGQIVILNGVPRSGKSSIAAVIQDTFDGVWMNLGVDLFMQAAPKRYRPGIGLRPGGERPDIESLIPTFYRAMYASIAAHSRMGLNVVVDVGHHDSYSIPRGILSDCARILHELPVLFVGVHCSLEKIMARRLQTGWNVDYTSASPVPTPVTLWQQEVHTPGIYDLEVDTSTLSPSECAEVIRKRLTDDAARSAFHCLAALPLMLSLKNGED